MATPERFGTQKVCWSVAQDRDRKKDTLLLIKEETITTCGCPDAFFVLSRLGLVPA